MPGDAQAQPAAHPWSLPRGIELRCPHCDYSLTGLPGDRCPECGSTIDLQRLIRWHCEPGLPIEFGPSGDSKWYPLAGAVVSPARMARELPVYPASACGLARGVHLVVVLVVCLFLDTVAPLPG